MRRAAQQPVRSTFQFLIRASARIGLKFAPCHCQFTTRFHSECRRHTICDILSSERNTPNLKFINHTVEEVGVTLTRCDTHTFGTEIHACIPTGFCFGIKLSVNIQPRCLLALRSDE
ncbi:hypothetical protein GBAR_LOCUS24132 [Geodia barretti]|uniref:Uncharacterized protein n=1 Tax=Geodia barretti TaxID=519541 RepID=A0AA35X457_GEOBA|nr:hypothetical protein GBAR_LOCUS24132 [Geodia barretti]